MIETQVQKLAKFAAMLDPLDLPGLISLGELFDQLCEMLNDPDLKPLLEKSKESAEILEGIVMHEIDDLEESFSTIHESIEYAQSIVNALSEGGSVSDIPVPGLGCDEEEVQEIDEELLASWISGCSDILEELEAQTIRLESEMNTESLDEVRRGIHTLKGECGVLSLGTAQRVCHEAETLIDDTTKHGKSFPANEILAVLDWIRSYTAALEANVNAPAPAYTDLLDTLKSQIAELQPQDTEMPSGETGNNDAPSVDKVVAEPADSVTAESTANPNALVEFPESVDPDENLSDFLGEAREHIAGAEEALLSLENDFSDLELINTVFRAFHTIKGVAGFMNLVPIVDAAHNAEFFLDEARKETVTLNSSYLDLILESCDMMSKLLAVLDGEVAPKQIDFNEHIEHLKRASKGEPYSPTKSSGGSSKQDVAAQSEAKPKPKVATEVTDSSKSAKSSTVASVKKNSNNVSVKVNTTRLDNLVTMVGELVIAQQMVLQDPSVQMIDDQRFQRNMSQTGKIIRDLQEVAMSLRMVTLKGLFQKMARLVRDVSTKAEKDVQFVMEGEDTELDRIVVEEIGDPLVHMIRNSCDHGIESAEDRIKAGKPAMGTLTLRAYHQGGSIIIEIEDDGKGLDRNRILEKAMERGIYSPDRDLAEIPDSEVFNLIMLPGFSTAAKVTDISGRGVGMDVVRRNIEALRGKLEIVSTAGKGSIFRMSLPLTMAIIDGMIVRVGSQRYVIPTLAIEQSFRATQDQINTVAGQGEMTTVRGSLLPIYRLNKIFDLDEGVTEINEGQLLVLESNDSRCCLLIDEIIGQQQVVIKRLGQGIEPLRGASGGAILGDGRVALIIDVGGLLSEAAQTQTEIA